MTKTEAAARARWKVQMGKRIALHHPKRMHEIMLYRVTQFVTGRYSALKRLEKKKQVPCTVTAEEIRTMVYEAYGQPCRYCGTPMRWGRMEIDHCVPVSDHGISSAQNLRMICRSCNRIKGSLCESDFRLLMEWLKQTCQTLAKDVRQRLARGGA